MTVIEPAAPLPLGSADRAPPIPLVAAEPMLNTVALFDDNTMVPALAPSALALRAFEISKFPLPTAPAVR